MSITIFIWMFSDLLSVKLYNIDIGSDELAKNAKTPAILESRILKKYNQQPGDFIFLEWEKLTEDILVTSERSALISGHTSRIQFNRNKKAIAFHLNQSIIHYQSM